MLNKVARKYLNALRYMPDLTLFSKGRFWQAWVNYTRRPMIFRDSEGFVFWQYPADPILRNHLRRAVGDSIGVRKYIVRNVQRGSIAIDIGACIGSVSVPLWSAAGEDSRIISIEADPRNIEKIKSNLRLNGYPDDQVFNFAIADHVDEFELKRFEGINGWQTIGSPSFAYGYEFTTFRVPATTLTNVWAEQKLGVIDLVKVDVEGSELLVFKGMAELLENKLIRKVIFEVNHLMLEGTGISADELMRFWSKYDCQLYWIDDGGECRELCFGQWPSGVIGDCLVILR